MAAKPALPFKVSTHLFQKMSLLIGEFDIDILLVGKSLRLRKVIVFH